MEPTHENITLAVLGERMSNVMGAVEKIKETMDGLATRQEIKNLVSQSEHSAAILALTIRIAAVEKMAMDNSPGHLIDVVTKLSISISAISAAGAVVWHFIRA